MNTYSYERNWFTKLDIYRRPGELYLTRYVLFRTPWASAYIHCFHLSDYTTHHDHPANFFSVPLTKGYWEHLPDGTVVDRKPFRPKFRTGEEFHFVELKPGTASKVWTFFMFFRRRREWGFLTKMGWIQHENYQLILDANDTHRAQYIRDEGL
jgi:hypothetical protein